MASAGPLRQDGAPGAEAPAQELRPWIGVRFLCAGHYLRVYRNKAGDAYLATCPRCARTVRFRVAGRHTSYPDNPGRH
jgi:hypothetical protein